MSDKNSEKTEPLLMGADEDFYSADRILFPENSDFGGMTENPILWAEGYNFELCEKYWSGEGPEYFPYEERVYVGEQEGEQDVVNPALAHLHPSFESTRRLENDRRSQGARMSQEPRRRSLFVHSSPTYFPDINKARKSAFGSVFLRTTAHVLEDAALLQSVANSSYSMLQSLLNSFDKIISSPTSDIDRRHMTVAYKESLLRALETHGISRTYSDGSIQWNIYPITHNFLFSLQLADRLHQTRFLSRVEDRLLTGPVQKPRLPYEWPTDSVWTGYWDSMGMAGIGTYIMPHGVSYNGKMQDGMLHDSDAMLTYPNQFKALHCVFEKGVLQSCQFQFPDLLMHEKENWDYCQFPDRRFWSEVRRGLKPAKLAQKTEHDPSRNIPSGCYDTSDGFYDPVSLMLVSPSGELLRVPVCQEDHWIKKYCRKGFLVYTDYRPDLFENWFNYDRDLINLILEHQALCRNGKITHDDLQQFYADLDLLPPWSKFNKRKTQSQIALEEFLQSIPPPMEIREKEKSNKYHEHKIPSTLLSELKKDFVSNNKPSKSTLKFDESKVRTLKNVTVKPSKISFRVFKGSSSSSEETITSKVRRKIPKKYMRHQPLLRPPFMSADSLKSRDPVPARKKCTRESFSSSFSSSSSLSEFHGETTDFAVQKYMRLQRFMKSIVMEIVSGILEKERKRHLKRLEWAQKPHVKEKYKRPAKGQNEKCLEILQQLYLSIPDVDEYCDSFPDKVWNLKDWAEDKFETIQYWGTRIFNLEFDETHSDQMKLPQMKQ